MDSYSPGPPPEDALAYFRAKGWAVGFDYRDVWREEHAAAFTVAKMMELDLLQDVRDAIDKALALGTPFEEFKKTLTTILQEKGWWGLKEMTDPLTGETRTVQLGSPRRLRIIYDANLRTARAAGQWQRIQRTKDTLPYLLYTLGPSKEHRVEHVRWHGTVLPVDDPWWKTHYPPNAWGCRCRVRPITRWEVDRLKQNGVQGPLEPSQRIAITTKAPPIRYVDWLNKRTGKVEKVPEGVDPGWDTNPGLSRLDYLNQLLAEKERQFSATG